jgi:hypothetical protein
MAPLCVTKNPLKNLCRDIPPPDPVVEGVSQVLMVCEIALRFGNSSHMASTSVKHPRLMNSKQPQPCKGGYHLPDAPIVECTRCHKPWYADHTARIAVHTYLYHATTVLCIECAPSVMATLREHDLIPNTQTVLTEVMEKAEAHAEHMPVIE